VEDEKEFDADDAGVRVERRVSLGWTHQSLLMADLDLTQEFFQFFFIFLGLFREKKLGQMPDVPLKFGNLFL
jgi:hypothetical protein